jgi:hypothetical protein
VLDWLLSAGHDGVMGEVRPRWAKLPPAERERRLAQSAADRACDRGPAASPPLLPEGERRRRQSQSDNARARVRGSATEAADLESDETLQAMWNTVEHGGYDFMSKDDW